MSIVRPLQESSWGAARVVASVDPFECASDGSILWENPSLGESFLGLGEAQVLTGDPDEVLAQIEADPVRWIGEVPEVPGPRFGGIAFDPGRPRSEAWSGFGSARFVLPELALARAGGRTYALAFARSDDADAAGAMLEERLEKAEALVLRAAGAERGAEAPAPRADSPSVRREVDPLWRALVEKALSAFASGELEKVVGAREIHRSLTAEVPPAEMVRRLRSMHPTCTSFVFAGSDGARFVGATPETLVRLTDGQLRTEALAGTLAPGQAAPGSKELHEHRFVVDAIRSALAASCSEIQIEAGPLLHALGSLVHLRTPIAARLRPGARMFDVVRALHPTPAVGGTPRTEALAFLRAHEPFDRGWYAGAIGWLGTSRAHLCVGLRSALVRGGELRAFAGAGLVAGSDPEAEWIETERKAAAVLGALGALT